MNTLDNKQAFICAGWFAARKIPVLPLVEFGKKPASRHGLKDATTDRNKHVRWWPAVPGYAHNMGAPTGLLFDVFDIDRGTGGFESLATLDWSALLDRSTHAVVATANEGIHLWVEPSGGGNTTALTPGIDYRGVGGYVVVPPSVTASSAWRWIVPWRPVAKPLDDDELARVEKVIWAPTTG